MARSSKKPRKNKLDPNTQNSGKCPSVKKESDWSFDEIARSKLRRR